MAVYSVIMLILNYVFVKFTITKLKYIETMLLDKYSTFRIYYYVPIDEMHYCSQNLKLK